MQSFLTYLKEAKKVTRADIVKVFGVVGGFNDPSRIEKEYSDEIDAALIAIDKKDMNTFYAIVGAENAADKKKFSKLIGEGAVNEAYITQDEKKKIVSRLKPIMKKYKVKATFGVRDGSQFLVNIKSAPFDIVNEYLAGIPHNNGVAKDYVQIHQYDKHGKAKGKTHNFLVELFEQIQKTNYDNSDVQSDYFDVGFYVKVSVGEWNNPFLIESMTEAAFEDYWAGSAGASYSNDIKNGNYSTVLTGQKAKDIVAKIKKKVNAKTVGAVKVDNKSGKVTATVDGKKNVDVGLATDYK